MKTVQERLTANRNKASDGCWVWLGFKDRFGYGIMWANGGPKRVHRLAYELWRKKIRKRMTIDHLCRNRACFNPNHLEEVSISENVMRGLGACALNSKKTSCKRGHELKRSNVYKTPKGGRGCRRCRRDYTRNYMRVRRAAIKK